MRHVSYNNDLLVSIYRLFMATRNPNLELPPDASSIIAEVNFTTTRAGLTGQVSTKILYSSVIHVRNT